MANDSHRFTKCCIVFTQNIYKKTTKARFIHAKFRVEKKNYKLNI